MERLAEAVELIDGQLDERTLAGNLRDLARLNRWLGGRRLSWRAVELVVRHLPPGGRLRLLDIGTGGADIPPYLRRSAAVCGADMMVTATDIRPEIVAIAQEATRGHGIEVRLASGDRIEGADGSFDVVHSSMVMHHLEPPAALEMLREMGRVAQVAVIVNDIDRGRHWLAWARLLSHLATRNRYTRHDAPLSVRRAYRPDELADLAAQAGLREAARLWARPRYRYALVFEKA